MVCVRCVLLFCMLAFMYGCMVVFRRFVLFDVSGLNCFLWLYGCLCMCVCLCVCSWFDVYVCDFVHAFRIL